MHSWPLLLQQQQKQQWWQRHKRVFSDKMALISETLLKKDPAKRKAPPQGNTVMAAEESLELNNRKLVVSGGAQKVSYQDRCKKKFGSGWKRIQIAADNFGRGNARSISPFLLLLLGRGTRQTRRPIKIVAWPPRRIDTIPKF